ncbi:MFS transporter [Schaalia sp. 19OD2882]|uniref:MFS transporter n=1 Tax=Schaalia sp. 19OD2882 TaxID=2794089 RepID=UPI001C1EBB50|nr:MFS transporter [Schaalia sp. 19OD2882]QWW18973.1 MFS transporter [Schaalia sp. 19OD2882]
MTAKDDEPVIDLEDLEMTPLLRRVIVFSSGGPFLEGYVLSIIGVALGAVGTDLVLDAHWSGLLGVAALAGLFLGASVGGWVTDLIGRRKMFVIDLIVIAVLSILCALVSSPVPLVVLRFLIGVAVGADYPIATSMIVEFSPRKHRAAAMGVIAAAWYLGANVAALVGFALVEVSHGWRYMLASSAIPCILILVGRWNIPESPRWLVSKGRIEEAKAIVRETLGANVRLPQDEDAQTTSVMKVLHGVYLKRVIFIGVIWLCQVIPMFALYTYGPQIISAVGLGEGRYVLLGELVIGTFFMLGTFPAMYLCERIGRRPLIIWCFAGMTVALAVIGFWPGAGIGLVMGCFISYAILSGGPGNLEWLYPNELFPTEIRATAMGFAMSLSRIGTVISIYVLPGFIDEHGISTTLLAGAGISALGLVTSLIWAPETRGYTLAQTGSPDFRGR